MTLKSGGVLCSCSVLKEKKNCSTDLRSLLGVASPPVALPSQRVCSKLFPPSAFHLREIFEVGFSERSNLNLKFAKFNLPRFRKRKPHGESFTFPINRTTLFLSLEGLLIRKFCRPVRILLKKYILLIQFTVYKSDKCFCSNYFSLSLFILDL